MNAPEINADACRAIEREKERVAFLRDCAKLAIAHGRKYQTELGALRGEFLVAGADWATAVVSDAAALFDAIEATRGGK